MTTERQASSTDQLANLRLKRENLLKRLAHQEVELSAKRKEAQKAK